MASPASLEADFSRHRLEDDNARPDGLISKASTSAPIAGRTGKGLVRKRRTHSLLAEDAVCA